MLRFLKCILYAVAACAVTCFSSSSSVFAARLSIPPSSNLEVYIGQTLEIPIELDAQGESVNAVQGALQFSPDVIHIEDIRTAQSIVPFWVEQPHVAPEGGVVFSGMIPGGFEEDHGVLFTLRVKILKQGDATVSWLDATVLKNDGLGTEARVTTSLWKPVLVTTGTAPEFPLQEMLDLSPPEPFIPTIAHDPNLFQDHWFVVFSTQDKNSGIDHYEIKEYQTDAQASEWVRAESPYELHDQELHSTIGIRAIDRQGNIRTQYVSPLHPLVSWPDRFYKDLWFLGILIGVFVYVAIRYIKRKKDRT